MPLDAKLLISCKEFVNIKTETLDWAHKFLISPDMTENLYCIFYQTWAGSVLNSDIVLVTQWYMASAYANVWKNGQHADLLYVP